MEEFLFIIPLSGGKEVSGIFVQPQSGFYVTAQEVLSAAVAEYPDENITRCEVWKRINHSTFKSVVTVYSL